MQIYQRPRSHAWAQGLRGSRTTQAPHSLGPRPEPAWPRAFLHSRHSLPAHLRAFADANRAVNETVDE